jgi:hypothetical protein
MYKNTKFALHKYLLGTFCAQLAIHISILQVIIIIF